MLYRISSMWLQHLSTLRPSLRCPFFFLFLMLLILSEKTKQHTLRSCNELTIDTGLAQPWHKASQYALSYTEWHVAFHSIADHAHMYKQAQKIIKTTEHEMTPRFFPWYIAHQINNLHSCTTHYVQNKGPNNFLFFRSKGTAPFSLCKWSYTPWDVFLSHNNLHLACFHLLY